MLNKKDSYIVAVVGATGVAGRELIEILEERAFPFSGLVLLDPEGTEGERIEVRGRNTIVKRLAKDAFEGVDIAFFFAGAPQSLAFVPDAVAAGAVVVDGSSAFRRDPQVPLVVPEVNPQAIENHAGIIANPGCSAIALVIALKPLHDAARIKRIVMTAFRSVSGTGKEAMDELAAQTVALLNFRDVEAAVYPRQIAFNCIPHAGAFLEDGSTEDEQQLAADARKILADDALQVTATAVRVPVFRGDAASINIETENPLPPNEARALLSQASGVVVYDDPAHGLYPLPIDVSGKDEVYVGRIRTDDTVANGLNLWVVSDNIRKGAALNAVQIAEYLSKQ